MSFSTLTVSSRADKVSTASVLCDCSEIRGGGGCLRSFRPKSIIIRISILCLDLFFRAEFKNEDIHYVCLSLLSLAFLNSPRSNLIAAFVRSACLNKRADDWCSERVLCLNIDIFVSGKLWNERVQGCLFFSAPTEMTKKTLNVWRFICSESSNIGIRTLRRNALQCF